MSEYLTDAAPAKLSTKPIRWGETNDPGVREARIAFALPRFMKRLYAWYLRYIRHDDIYAGLVENCSEKTVEQYLGLIAKREGYREQWFEKLKNEAIDFVLTVPNALPATPHGGMKSGFKGCGYTFLFNIVSSMYDNWQEHAVTHKEYQLDYSAGVLPVTHVDKELDALDTKAFKPRNAIERDMYQMYDSKKMHGLPVGVQVVGKRLEEEKVLEAMKTIEALLKESRKAYTLLSNLE